MSVDKEQLKDKVRLLPEKPGVYQFFDSNGQIIYVGKAKNLKKRVTSYFAKQHDNGKTILLVKRIANLEYVVVGTELDALLLENNLIKKYQPKYNIQLKDDKTYPWICIKKERFPRVFSTRQLIRDGSKYYGPYGSVRVMNTLLDLIRELYPLRTCALDLSEEKIQQGKFKVCLEYHLGNCKAPCVGKQKEDSYLKMISQIEDLLKGNISGVLKVLRHQMKEQAALFLYEEAQLSKERIQALERYQAKSTVVSPRIHQVDVITMIEEKESAFINYLSIHNGAIVHAYTTEVKKKLDETRSDILGYVLPELRERYNSSSKEILTDEKPVDFFLSDLQFNVPQRGDKKELLDLSLRNVRFYILEKRKQEKIKNPEKHTERILEQLKKDFRLKDLPIHMECFDNSNFQGTNAVSACVVFKDAKPSKKDYRHFNVKTVEGPDDFATMEEVVYRRYSRMIAEGNELPQLIVIDGGKGQLSAAMNAIDKLALRGKTAVVGIAKKLEEIYFPGDQYPVYIDKRSESLKVIQHMRNEAHRFGITHHRNKRSKGAVVSELDSINGVGEATKSLLLRKFKSVSKIKDATLEDLSAVVGKSKGLIVYNYFHK
ncbi:MAG: excinuclease ABC subunit UvrC [Bacteroidetes bacterium]|nr:MAG: excinuclease ABC subunit UvrC [Bacteroidota bacterium]